MKPAELWEKLKRGFATPAQAGGLKKQLGQHAVVVGVASLVLGTFVLVFLFGGESGRDSEQVSWSSSPDKMFSRYVSEDPGQRRTLIDTSLIGARGQVGEPLDSPASGGPGKPRARRELPDIGSFESQFDADSPAASASPGEKGSGKFSAIKSFADQKGSSSKADVSLKGGNPPPKPASGEREAGSPAQAGKASGSAARGFLGRLSARLQSAVNRIRGGPAAASGFNSFGDRRDSGPGFGPGGTPTTFQTAGGIGGGGSGRSEGGVGSASPASIGAGGSGGGGGNSGGGGSSGGGDGEKQDLGQGGPEKGSDGGGGWGAAGFEDEKKEGPTCKKAGETRCTILACAEGRAKLQSTAQNEIAEEGRQGMLKLLAELKTEIEATLEQEATLRDSAGKLKYPCEGCGSLKYCAKWARDEAGFVVAALDAERTLLLDSSACLDKETLPDPAFEPPTREDCHAKSLEAIQKERELIEGLASKQAVAKSQFDRCVDEVPTERDGKPYETGVKAREDFRRFADYYIENQTKIAEFLKESWCLRHPELCDTSAQLAKIVKLNEENDFKGLLEELIEETPKDVAEYAKPSLELSEKGVIEYQTPQGDESRSIVRGRLDFWLSAIKLARATKLLDPHVRKACGKEDPRDIVSGSGASSSASSGEKEGWKGPGPRGDRERPKL